MLHVTKTICCILQKLYVAYCKNYMLHITKNCMLIEFILHCIVVGNLMGCVDLFRRSYSLKISDQTRSVKHMIVKIGIIDCDD